MRITLSKRNELDVLIRAVQQMADTGEVSFEFGRPDGLMLSYAEATEKNVDLQLGDSTKQSIEQLNRTKEWNEAYAAGRIDSLMTALDLGLITITDAAVLLDMDEGAAERIYEIWHDDEIHA